MGMKIKAMLLLVALAGCERITVPALASFLPGGALPAMRWDVRAEAKEWTTKALAAVARHDGELASRVPGDIAVFCPGYAKRGVNDRRAFWVGLMSAVARYESGFNPQAVGGGGRYVGLMQISPQTARQYGCGAGSSAALKDGAANLACAVQVFAPHVAADGMVAGGGNRGMARDWGPTSKRSDRAEIVGWTSKQAYCKG